MVSFPQVSPPGPCAPLSPSPYVPNAPRISFFSILPPAQYLVSNKTDKMSNVWIKINLSNLGHCIMTKCVTYVICWVLFPTVKCMIQAWPCCQDWETTKECRTLKNSHFYDHEDGTIKMDNRIHMYEVWSEVSKLATRWQCRQLVQNLSPPVTISFQVLAYVIMKQCLCLMKCDCVFNSV